MQKYKYSTKFQQLLTELKFYCDVLDKLKYNGKSISEGKILNFSLCHYYKLIYLLKQLWNLLIYVWNMPGKRDWTISVITYFIEEPLGYFNIQISWIFSSNNVRVILVQALVPLTADITVKLLACIMERFFKALSKGRHLQVRI